MRGKISNKTQQMLKAKVWIIWIHSFFKRLFFIKSTSFLSNGKRTSPSSVMYEVIEWTTFMLNSSFNWAPQTVTHIWTGVSDSRKDKYNTRHLLVHFTQPASFFPVFRQFFVGFQFTGSQNRHQGFLFMWFRILCPFYYKARIKHFCHDIVSIYHDLFFHIFSFHIFR